MFPVILTRLKVGLTLLCKLLCAKVKSVGENKPVVFWSSQLTLDSITPVTVNWEV